MKIFKLIPLYLLCFLCSCSQEKMSNPISETASDSEVSETAQMAKFLSDLAVSGNPKDHYHWNTRIAEQLKSQLETAPANQRMPLWFKYCNQLLNAGKTEQCITEIEKFIQTQNLSYNSFMSEQSYPLIELLALAYLRKGEVENCQNNHNEFSCIFPLLKPAFHTLTTGSEKAIELYSLLYRNFPQDRFKWLVNLAYMTLGKHPQEVPQDLLVEFPSVQKERQNFKPFKEVAMGLNIAQDGLSGGVCFDDFNNDGKIDVFTTSYGMQDQCKFFLNTGTGFHDATEEAGLKGIVSGLNCIHADYDNDGKKDILILRGAWLGKGGLHPNSLLKNIGDGTFSDVTKSSGIFSLHPTQTAAWADVNGDGWLDLFIGNESRGKQAHPCELYINRQDGTFKEEADERGLGSILGFVKGVSFGDINNDKQPDLFISVMGGKNLLYKNESGHFKNISASAGIEEPIYSFPCWFWDVNHDGLEDIFVSSYDLRGLKEVGANYVAYVEGKPIAAEQSRLFINTGNESFSEQSQKYNLNHSLHAMGANFGDLDNDGWLDCYIGTGTPEFTSVVPNRMFRNKGGKSFEEVSSAGQFGHIQKGHGIGFADFDNDGDQDIYAVMGGAFEGDKFPNVCFRNPGFQNNWIVLDLEGVQSNKSAIGTRISITTQQNQTFYHTVNTGGSFGSGSLEAEIGLGKANKIKSLIITWPQGAVQTFTNLEVNKKYKLVEGQDAPAAVEYSSLSFDYSHHGHVH